MVQLHHSNAALGDLVHKVKQVLILTVLKAKFDCTGTRLYWFKVNLGCCLSRLNLEFSGFETTSFKTEKK